MPNLNWVLKHLHPENHSKHSTAVKMSSPLNSALTGHRWNSSFLGNWDKDIKLQLYPRASCFSELLFFFNLDHPTPLPCPTTGSPIIFSTQSLNVFLFPTISGVTCLSITTQFDFQRILLSLYSLQNELWQVVGGQSFNAKHSKCPEMQ